MKHHRTVSILCVAGIVPQSLPAAEHCSMQALRFLEGAWQRQDGATRGEERWSLTAADTLLGSAWEAKDKSLSFSEFSSIQPAGDGIEMHLRHFDGALMRAWEDKDAPMIFTAARCGAGSAVFDGTGTRQGEHITYRRDGDHLTFIGDFLRKGQPFRVEITLQRVAR
jgi:Domain of unknown function (DUF6265)